MKRIVQSAVVLGMVSLASVTSLQAQGPGRASFFIGGGLSLPQGEDSDVLKAGFNGTGGVMFGLGGLPVKIRVDGQYSRFGGEDAAEADCAALAGATSCDLSGRIFGGNVDAVYEFGASASPVKVYVMAGLGYADVKFEAEIDGVTADVSESGLSFNGGGGVAFGMGSLNFFAEARYISVQTDPEATKYIPITVGIRFGGGM
jgi:opacity protein-like surface antigen